MSNKNMTEAMMKIMKNRLKGGKNKKINTTKSKSKLNLKTKQLKSTH